MIEKTQEQVMKLWKDNNPLVTIKCLAYNHQDFIRQALDGFLSQITDFAFEIIVHDDASKDKTADIIREYEKKYPKIINPIYQKENQYSKHDHSISRIIHERTKGRYVAVCEGDDYWIDEYKLQKEINYLQNNPDCSLCFTNFNVFYQNKGVVYENVLTERPNEYPSEFTLEEWILKAGYTAPMTWVYKVELYDTFERLNSLDFSFEFFAHALATSKVGCLKNYTTAVYRIGHESAVCTSEPKKKYKRAKSLHDVKLKMVYNYKLDNSLINRINNDYYNKAYLLISLNYDITEMSQAKKYCSKLSQKVILYIVRCVPVRKLLCKIYKYKHKTK